MPKGELPHDVDMDEPDRHGPRPGPREGAAGRHTSGSGCPDEHNHDYWGCGHPQADPDNPWEEGYLATAPMAQRLRRELEAEIRAEDARKG
jgi:hypothetical protein